MVVLNDKDTDLLASKFRLSEIKKRVEKRSRSCDGKISDIKSMLRDCRYMIWRNAESINIHTEKIREERKELCTLRDCKGAETRVKLTKEVLKSRKKDRENMSVQNHRLKLLMKILNRSLSTYQNIQKIYKECEI